jgi:cytochrome c oxidase accessory protein FixG
MPWLFDETLMSIDLTDRIIQPPPKKAVKLHPLRRVAQLVLGFILVMLPLVNGIRVDIPAGKFCLLGQSFTAQNMVLLFYGCAIGAVVLLCVSMLYGRWWCGWICPQTLASDFGDSLKQRIDHLFKLRLHPERKTISRIVWAALMLAMAVATAAIVCTYFYPPLRVWTSLEHPLGDTRVFVHLAIISAIIGGDLLFVRRHFCRRGCPYGLMLSLIGDSKSMTVRYIEERGTDCIECKKCVTICPMAIDIRQGANQMECIGCGECIDACNDILPRIKANPKPGLIELSYGPSPGQAPSQLKGLQKIGLWDARRLFVLATSIILIGGFFFEIFGTHRTTVSIAPSGMITQSGGYIFERYTLTIDNGKPQNERYALAANGVNRLFLLDTNRVFAVPRSGKRTIRITLAVPIGELDADQRYPVNITVQSLIGSKDSHQAAAIFYVPEPPAQVKAG